MKRSAAGWGCRAAEVVLPALALVLAAGLYFRELLPLPEPTHFRYEPFTFRRGLAFALLAGLGAVAGVGVERWRPR